MKPAKQSQVAYTTHGDGQLIIPLTIGVVVTLVGLAGFVAANMAIVWILWAIHPVWGPFIYEFMWLIGLIAIVVKCFRWLGRTKRA